MKMDAYKKKNSKYSSMEYMGPNSPFLNDINRVEHERKLYNIKEEKFFESIIDTLLSDVSQIDVELGQGRYYIKPDEKGIFYDADLGDLYVPVNGEFNGRAFSFGYSLWHLGNIIKVGIKIEDIAVLDAIENDEYKEINSLWNKNTPRVDILHDCVFYDWEFGLFDDFLDSIQGQKMFILGMRHMHIRMLRIIYSYMVGECKK